MSQHSYTMTTDTITVVFRGDVHTVRRGAPNFEDLRAALYLGQWDKVPNFLSVAGAIESWSQGNFKVVGQDVRMGDEVLPRELSERVVAMVSEKKDPASILNFWGRLRRNPSKRSVDQLWSFLNHKGIPLTEDGCFLAYKSVRRNFLDHHSGTVDNKVGVVNEMARNQISDDPRQACHEGYHVGALNYAQTFGGEGSRIIICKVDPMDVVCVPYDSSSEKMRVCKYEVVGHHGSDFLPSTVCDEEASIAGVDYDEDGDYEDEDYEDEVEDVPVPKAVKPAPKPDSKAKAMAKIKTKAKTKPEHVPLKKSKRGSGWAKFDRMDEDKLLAQSIDSLRKYASNGLLIFGASKIPGGKVALVARIMDVREV